MYRTKHPPIAITENFFHLGTPAFPAFLSMGEVGMLIEGGTGPTFPIIREQIRALGISPEKIRYIALTHTHADHIGGIPHFKRVWPHIGVIGSVGADKIFQKRDLFHEYILADTAIAQLMKAKEEISDLPPFLTEYHFGLDSMVKEGETIDLGKGIVWERSMKPRGIRRATSATLSARKGLWQSATPPASTFRRKTPSGRTISYLLPSM